MPLEPTNDPRKIPSTEGSFDSAAESEPLSEEELFKKNTLYELTGRSNKSDIAIDREYEQDLIGASPAPCIAGWTAEQITDYANTCGSGGYLFAVAVPPSVIEILANSSFPLSNELVTKLEALVDEYNGVAPEHICADDEIAIRGRIWKFFPEVAPVLTGFDYFLETE